MVGWHFRKFNDLSKRVVMSWIQLKVYEKLQQATTLFCLLNKRSFIFSQWSTMLIFIRYAFIIFLYISLTTIMHYARILWKILFKCFYMLLNITDIILIQKTRCITLRFFRSIIKFIYNLHYFSNFSNIGIVICRIFLKTSIVIII